MLSWAITFLVIGLVAGVLGISGVAGTATYIASGKCSVLSAQGAVLSPPGKSSVLSAPT